MKGYMEEIIEVILENVSCNHQEIEEFPRGPKFDDVTYNLKGENTVIKECQKIIMMNKPVITGKSIDKKATELHDKLWPHDKFCGDNCSRTAEIKEFLGSLLNEES